MTLSRRQLMRSACTLAAAAAATSAWPARARTPRADDAWFFDWQTPTDGVFVAIGAGGNSMLVRGKDAAMLVDCKNAPYGAGLRREGEAHAKPITQVVNTHHHADHTGGNHAFSADTDIIAHDNATPRVLTQLNRYISQMKESIGQLDGKTGAAADKIRDEAKELYLRHAKVTVQEFAPRTTFAKDRTLDIGGVSAVLTHFGPGHTDNDIIVFLPAQNVLHTGDLLFYNRHPYIDRGAGANTRAWQESLRKVIALCNDKTIVVPGHGLLTNVSGLRAQIEYFDTMRDIVAKAQKAGKSRKEVAEMDPGVFKTYEGGGVRSIALGAMYDELAAE